MCEITIIKKSDIEELLLQMVDSVVAQLIEKTNLKPTPGVMTLQQLAEYWQVSKQSIINWVKREEYSLPVHYVGGDPRFHLMEVNTWSKSEGIRRLERS